jgi:hypothetical protein
MVLISLPSGYAARWKKLANSAARRPSKSLLRSNWIPTRVE